MVMLKKVERRSDVSSYQKFNQINGDHPLKKLGDDFSLCYQARSRPGGKVTFFNYDLAKTMGLIASNHPAEMNSDLEESILKTFSIVIINEYDKMSHKKFNDILPQTYMATRYLQLQHPNKQGKTSGDGRSLWNGQISHKGMTWDISSCGTGATSLSPATHLFGKYFQTGDPSISYGCGYAEVDEGLSSLFFSEVLKKNHHTSETVLAVIEFSKGLSINVRAHPCLLRPSHFFRMIKCDMYEPLKELVDYYLNLQSKNEDWKDLKNIKKEKDRYQFALHKITNTFAEMSARFEDDYIFCWLDWDGDNILMDGGIIDYGSIRQFGLFHHEYRYDDIERFSTSITEQKQKTKYIVQCFTQIFDYLLTGKKKPLQSFSHHKSLKEFDQKFLEHKKINILHKIGMSPLMVESIFDRKMHKTIQDFQKSFSYFERSKSKRGPVSVADGINWNAIFCMRDILRELPQFYLANNFKHISADEFICVVRSTYASNKDCELTFTRRRMIDLFQKSYQKMIVHLAKEMNKTTKDVLLEICMRSSIINKYDRVTGDSITNVVDRILHNRPKLNCDQIFSLMKDFSEYQNRNPETKKIEHQKKRPALYQSLVKIVRDYREGL
jgi:hypothetical protein